MIRFSRQRVFWTFLFPVLVLGVASLVGCQDQGAASVAARRVDEAPEAVVRRLIDGWAEESASRSPYAQTGTTSTPTIILRELTTPASGSTQTVSSITLTVDGAIYPTTEDAWVYASNLQNASFTVAVIFKLILTDLGWSLNDYVFTRTPITLPPDPNAAFDPLSDPTTPPIATGTLIPVAPVVSGFGVSGYIKNPQTGLPIANAAVALYQGETLIDSTLTDANGYYFIAATAAGTYTLTVAKDGYEFMTVPGLVIQ